MHYPIKYSKDIKIVIDNVPLPMVTKVKFLGIWIDNHLTWQPHFNQLCLKIIRNTTLLRLSKSHLTTNTKKILYYAHIYSHLVYAITTWGNMIKKEHLNKLQKLQNRCISLISNKDASSEVYQSLKIMKVKDIIKLQNLKLGFKVQHSQLPENVLTVCITDSNRNSLIKHHPYNTCRKNEQNCPKPSMRWYQISFLVKSINEFQSLPGSIRNISEYN